MTLCPVCGIFYQYKEIILFRVRQDAFSLALRAEPNVMDAMGIAFSHPDTLSNDDAKVVTTDALALALTASLEMSCRKQ